MTSFAGLLFPVASKVKAIFFSFLMAFEGGLSKVSLNSDATSIINIFNRDFSIFSKVCLLVDDIKDPVHRFNEDVSFSHSPGTANRIAHSLTKLALNEFFHVIWVDDSHPSLINLILEESNLSL
ncbi:hypothetical protein ACOSQ2_015801 [Xanthoceras sorbifolium]